ncbi:MAG: beta-ketoacyl-ACP synthase II [Gracilibacteraceae bacterium]|jgi:3-oxoacyl-[acyl-carrier-protein] synthase II|nr:beta-ketoacyl-ACP synthase II [Gracilibacteraceae bacterium]
MRRIVITGIGAVTPIGNSAAAFWEALTAGRNGIGRITHFELPPDYKATLAAELKGFDPLNYMDAKSARRSDPFTHYAVAAAEEAMRDSDLVGHVDPERFAIYTGSGIGGLKTITGECEKYYYKGARRVSPLFIPMLIPNMAAGILAIQYQALGSCLTNVTACATSSHTLGEAYRAIKHGYADAVLAGGSEATIEPVGVTGFLNMTALTTSADPEAASLPFDKRRAGFVMGEGAGMVVLEEYERAKARGAKIYAELAGYGTTCDAYHITAPNPDGNGPARAIKAALAETGQGEEARLYINAHGTGTPINDKTETLAIKQALGEERARRTPISSSKSMIGHMLGAAGAVEAIAAVFALREGLLPPTIGLREPDPECDLDCIPWTARRQEIDMALSVSLGFGGHNVCLAFTKVDEH